MVAMAVPAEVIALGAFVRDDARQRLDDLEPRVGLRQLALVFPFIRNRPMS